MDGNPAAPRPFFLRICDFPNVPATNILENIALGILHVSPFKNLNTRLLDEARYVEDIAERHVIAVYNMRRREHPYYGDATGYDAEVDEIHVCHDIVC